MQNTIFMHEENLTTTTCRCDNVHSKYNSVIVVILKKPLCLLMQTDVNVILLCQPCICSLCFYCILKKIKTRIENDSQVTISFTIMLSIKKPVTFKKTWLLFEEKNILNSKKNWTVEWILYLHFSVLNSEHLKKKILGSMTAKENLKVYLRTLNLMEVFFFILNLLSFCLFLITLCWRITRKMKELNDWS